MTDKYSSQLKNSASRYWAGWRALALSLIAAALTALSSCTLIEPDRTGVLVLPLRMGLAKDNGASPWYGELSIGGGPSGEADSAGQLFEFIMDTGTSSTWVTSRMQHPTVPPPPALRPTAFGNPWLD
jgi:hypothetical protein